MVWFGLGWNQCAWLYSLINWLSWLSPTVELIGTFNLPPTQRSSPPMEFVEGTLPVQLKIYIQYRAGKDQWVKSKSEHCSSMNFKLYASQLVLSYKVSSCYRFQPGFAGSLFWTLQAWNGTACLSCGPRSDICPWTILGFKPRISSSIQLSLPRINQSSGDRNSETSCVFLKYRNMTRNSNWTWQEFRDFFRVLFIEMSLLGIVAWFWSLHTPKGFGNPK